MLDQKLMSYVSLRCSLQVDKI
uniref:Uncharacterized protein n=1 Tax=Rhizophora mucronata TaxID=61149 RepID=A0A2P2R4M2_RHIMU